MPSTAAERAVRKFGFQGAISLSHQVSGEYREYERTCTTVIDAYVRPRMATYLRRLEEKLREVKCLPAAGIYEAITEDLLAFSEPADDISLVVIKRVEAGG